MQLNLLFLVRDSLRVLIGRETGIDQTACGSSPSKPYNAQRSPGEGKKVVLMVTSVPSRAWRSKISEEMKEESDRLGRERAAVLQAAMGLLWKGYSDHAWGYDEVGKTTCT